MPRRAPRRPAREPRTPGRPPAVGDPALVARMLDAIRSGVPITQAVLHAGLSSSAHFRAMEAGEAAQAAQDARDAAREAGDNPDTAAPPLTARERSYREYREAIIRARAGVAVVNVELVGEAARGGALTREVVRERRDGTVETEREWQPPQWKAAQFLLQTSFRDDFAASSRQQVEHTGADGGPVRVAGAADEALVTIAERMRAVAELQSRQSPGGWDRPRELAASERVDVDQVGDDRVGDDGEPALAELVEDGREDGAA